MGHVYLVQNISNIQLTICSHLQRRIFTKYLQVRSELRYKIQLYGSSLLAELWRQPQQQIQLEYNRRHIRSELSLSHTYLFIESENNNIAAFA